MLKKWWIAILRWLGLMEEDAARVSITRQPVPSNSVAKEEKHPEKRKLYEGAAFDITASHRQRANRILFRIKDGKEIGPKESQLAVIYSNHAGISVSAGAGSGKSATLVQRVLFMHKYLDIGFDEMVVFTFTRKSRAEFIERLIEEAPHWNISMPEKRAERLVRTFHSKALGLAYSFKSNDEKIYEFLGGDKRKKDARLLKEENKGLDSETAQEAFPYETLSEEEAAANELDGFQRIDESPEQLEVLRTAFERAFTNDSEFRDAIRIIAQASVPSSSEEQNAEYKRQMAFIGYMQDKDKSLCEHLEDRWKIHGWPTRGVETLNSSGQRFTIGVAGGKTFFADGYIPSLGVYVILGEYNGISTSRVDVNGATLQPKFDVRNKRLVVLASCNAPVRYVRSPDDLSALVLQIQVATGEMPIDTPAVELILAGEFIPKNAFAALYAFCAFAENIGLNPAKLKDKIPENELTSVERATLHAAVRFYMEFTQLLKDRRLITFNQIFSRLGEGSSDLKSVSDNALRGIRHILIDEFQDVSPLILRFIVGIQNEFSLRMGETGIRPTVMGVGDDWQSIYGWRGSSPHFLLDFHNSFPGAHPHPLKMSENFRSSQLIIDAAEQFMQRVSGKSDKKGVASNDGFKDLKCPIISVEKYKPADVESVVKGLLSIASKDEKIYMLSERHALLSAYKQLQDSRLMKTTFHQSKGLQAEYVVLLGSPRHFGRHKLKSLMTSAANFPKDFDEAQRDEAYRVAYVAATRAKKVCIWFAPSTPNQVVSHVPPDGVNRTAVDVEDVLSFVERSLGMPMPGKIPEHS